MTKKTKTTLKDFTSGVGSLFKRISQLSPIENEWLMWRFFDQYLDEGFSPLESWERAQEKIQEQLS